MKRLASIVLSSVVAFAAALSSHAGDYTWLQWVESTGTQYVDTGIDGKSGLSVKAYITGASYGDVTYIGAQDNRTFSWGKGSVQVIPIAAGWSYGLCFKFGTSKYQTIQWSSVPDGIYEVVLKATSQTFKITNAETGDVIKEASYSTSVVNDTERNLYVFACNDTGEAKAFSKMKLHSLQIRQDDVLVRDFYPAKRNSDGAIGLYDNVSGEFFQSGSGTALIAGDEGGEGPGATKCSIKITGKYATPNPAYGIYECDAGSTCNFTCPAVWTNGIKSLVATCTGWSLSNDVEQVLSGTGNTASFTCDASYDMATFTWQFSTEVLAADLWSVDDADNPTTMTSGDGETILKVSKDDTTTLRITGFKQIAADGKVDLTMSVYSSDGAKQFTVTKLSDSWDNWSHPFENCTELKEVIIPESVTYIGVKSFNGCTALERVVLHEKLTAIYASAFYGCSALTNVTPNLPSSVTTIGQEAFCDCTKLPNFTLPPNVTALGVFAFKNCKALTEVTIPDSVTAIEGSFSGCTALTNFYPRFLPPQITSIGPSYQENGFANMPVTGDLIFDNPAVTRIGARCFYECSNVTNLDMSGSSISNFAYSAFLYMRNLKKVTFSACLRTLPDTTQLFQGDTKLREVVFLGPPPEVGRNPFDSEYYIIRVSRKSGAWTQYIAEHSVGDDPWVTDMTDDEKALFRERFPGEKCRGKWINLGGKTGKRYLGYIPNELGLSVIVR